MKYMVCWTIPPSSYKPACASFLETGAPLPAGIKALGRWHAPGSARGWLLAEGDVNVLAQHMAEWAHVLESEITPVIDDDAAAKAIAAVHGG